MIPVIIGVTIIALIAGLMIFKSKSVYEPFAVQKGSGPGSDAQYALDVMNFTEMKELPSKYNSGAVQFSPEGLVNRVISLMNYPRDNYYRSHKDEFISPDWPGVLADYFYNIMLPQISPDKRAALQTKVDTYMINIIKGKLVPALQGVGTAPLPPAVSGGAAVPASTTPTQAPATTSNTSPSPQAPPTTASTTASAAPATASVTASAAPVTASVTASAAPVTASLPPVPRDTPQQLQNPTPSASLTASSPSGSMAGSAPAPVESTQRVVVVPSTQVPVTPAPETEYQPLPNRVLSNDEKKASMDFLLNVLSPNSLADLGKYEEFIKKLPDSFNSTVTIYKEDYFTKDKAPTLQFIDTIYRLYKPYESMYYLVASQSPLIPFDRTFKVYMANLTNDAKLILRYEPSQIKSLENSLLTWIPPANRNAAQPVISNLMYPAAASSSYILPANLSSLAESIKKTIREQLAELKITAGVTTAPTTGSGSEVSPSLVQGFMNYQRRVNSGCPNCYPTPWTPDGIPFNPNDYIRKDKIPCAKCIIP